jgi:hypothetical protein
VVGFALERIVGRAHHHLLLDGSGNPVAFEIERLLLNRELLRVRLYRVGCGALALKKHRNSGSCTSTQASVVGV